MQKDTIEMLEKAAFDLWVRAAALERSWGANFVVIAVLARMEPVIGSPETATVVESQISAINISRSEAQRLMRKVGEEVELVGAVHRSTPQVQ